MTPVPSPRPDPPHVLRQAGIPRHQRYLFWALAAGILLALAFLLHGCRTAEQRLATPQDETPIAAPTSTGNETVNLYLASDADGSITVDSRALALPAEPSTRARALLDQLLALYSLPGSAHPLPPGPAVDDVFLLALPLQGPSETASNPRKKPLNLGETTHLYGYTGDLAVVNLHGAFADNHPSGVEEETLTLNSIIGTLHANLPQVSEIRFVVDGHPRDTLAGHADLTRTYPATDTATIR